MRGPKGTNEIVIIGSDTLTVDAPAFQQAVEGLTAELAALVPEIIREGSLTNFYESQSETLVSADRQTTLIPLTMAGDFDDAADNIDRVVTVVNNAKGESGFQILITGQASVGRDFQEVSEEDLLNGEMFGVPIALVILLLVLGALVASLIPIVQAAVSIAVAMGAASLVGQAFELSFFVTNMITMIGLAVGIDYSLFIIARYREERRNGLEKSEAIGRAGATASRTVLFSGLTVVLALFGMLLIPSAVFISVGLGAILVVIASVLASLTLLPAILSLLGDRINSLSIPLIGRAQASFDETRRGGIWDRISQTVMGHAVLSLVLAGGLLLGLSVALLDINTGAAGVSSFPDGIESKQGFLILDEEFSAGEVTPAEIVIDGDIDSPAVQSGIDDLRAALEADGAFAEPRPLEVNSAGDLALLSVPVTGDATSTEAQDAVKRLREEYVPAAFAGLPATVLVSGDTAVNLDFFTMASESVPIVFSFVLSISFILLMVVFRSIIVPIKAIILNLLSVGATYGLLVLVFQKGVLNEVFGYQRTEVIEAWIPLFLFSVLFGLSMDYHVFLLSRIRERFDQTQDNAESVSFGIRSTGRLITGAALIMVSVFMAFSSGQLVSLQQMGFGLGVAVLLDATIVRIVLVPASMKLLGNWNWYLSPALSWLPDLRVEPSEMAAVPVRSDDD